MLSYDDLPYDRHGSFTGLSLPDRLRRSPRGGSADGSWQFHLGDTPEWADPAFDDDNWEQLRLSSTTARSFSPELYRWA
jgi:hypothetical protein